MLLRQRGYFLLLAVLLILVIGVLGSVMISLLASGGMQSVNQHNGLKAFYNAESGLQIAAHYLWRPTVNTSPPRIACSSVTGNSQLTDATLNGGTFTVSTINSSPIYAGSVLSTAVSASATTISAVSTVGFAPNGRVIIDREAVDYAGISGNNLIGVTRGVAGTLASSHPSGAGVGQYQCSLDVQAGIPSVVSPTFLRELQTNVQLQDGWVAANMQSSSFVLSHWNYPTELSWTASSYPAGSSAVNLNAISMLSNVDGWAVGDRGGSNFIFTHWDGATWNLVTLASSCSNQHLYGVSMVSATQGFAVGNRYRPNCASSGSYRYTILVWNGSVWSRLVPSAIPADSSNVQQLNAVHVIDTDGDGLGNIGFTVGDSGTVIQYNGSTWVANTSPVSNNLTGVYTVSALEAWAVGAKGTILRWNGSTWSVYSSPTTTALSAIAMLDTDGDGLADFGVAVGNSAKILMYNGSSWSVADYGSANLFGVDIYNTSDAWAVGAGGTILHWDNTTWNTIASGTSNQINGISLVRQGQPAISIWRQIYR